MKAVILCAGFIAEFHARGYGSQLCAVCDTDASKAQELAQKYDCLWRKPSPSCRRWTPFTA